MNRQTALRTLETVRPGTSVEFSQRTTGGAARLKDGTLLAWDDSGDRAAFDPNGESVDLLDHQGVAGCFEEELDALTDERPATRAEVRAALWLLRR